MSKLSKIAKIENEMKRIMRDNEITPKFTWKTFKELKKPWAYNQSKIHFEVQSRCTRIYLAQDLQSLIDYLTNTFSPLHHAFIFKNMLGVLPKLDLGLLLEVPSRRKWVFTETKMNERWIFKELNPFFFLENLLENFSWRLEWNFLGKQTTSKREREWRAHSRLLL